MIRIADDERGGGGGGGPGADELASHLIKCHIIYSYLMMSKASQVLLFT